MAVVNRRTVKVRLAIIAVLLIGYFGFRLASGNHEPVVPKRQPVERVGLDSSNRHDLSRDEARGDRTQHQHMGKTADDVLDRLHTGCVSATSAYTERPS